MTEADAKTMMDKALDECCVDGVRGAYLTVIHDDGTRSERFISRDSDGGVQWRLAMGSTDRLNREFPLKAQKEYEAMQ